MRYAGDGRTAASLPRYDAEVHTAQGWSIPAASKLQSRYCDAMQMIHGNFFIRYYTIASPYL